MTGHATACKAPWAALVVDDDAGVRQSLRLCLEAAGARVLGVATGGAALEALDRGHFDVVFLDLWLGADAGLDLLPEMLQRQPDLGRHRRHGVCLDRERGRRDQARRGRLRPEAVYARSDPPGRESRASRRSGSAPPGGTPAGAGRERRAGVLRVSQSAVSQFLQTAARAAASDAVLLLARRERNGQERAGALDSRRTVRAPRRRSSPSTVRRCRAI